jgi:hypothetical protein
MKIKECPYSLKSSSLSPESLINVLMESGRSSGLLPVCGLPVFYNSGMQHKQFTEFTATGIAPEFNRIPILMALVAPTIFRGQM